MSSTESSEKWDTKAALREHFYDNHFTSQILTQLAENYEREQLLELEGNYPWIATFTKPRVTLQDFNEARNVFYGDGSVTISVLEQYTTVLRLAEANDYLTAKEGLKYVSFLFDIFDGLRKDWPFPAESDRGNLSEDAQALMGRESPTAFSFLRVGVEADLRVTMRKSMPVYHIYEIALMAWKNSGFLGGQWNEYPPQNYLEGYEVLEQCSLEDAVRLSPAPFGAM